ncbi:hypothetical protein HY380_00575 [Candidatus Saccharibacteria bacterium]|nr:hypothetical protein [Candidatus Saccharibacteria bacterium]
METAAQVLLIIVSATLAIFLITLTIALVVLIRVLRRAEVMANTVESAAIAARRMATAMPFVRLITRLVSKKRKG